MGTGNTLTQEYGINTILTGTGADDIALVGWLDDDPGLLAVATVSDDPTLTVGDNAVAAGDSSGVDRMLAVFTEEVSFAEAGHLSATETTLGGYAGDIMGGASVRLDSAETASITANAVLGTLEARMSSETGVNLDEETARLEELQSSYEAAATLMSVVSEMFDSLISAVN